VHEPANLVFDEPTNGLDVMSARVRRESSGRRRRLRSARLEPRMPEVAALCDRVVIMAGAAVASGTPSALPRRPAAHSKMRSSG
jgi:sodium transport system ATP-binding protein